MVSNQIQFFSTVPTGKRVHTRWQYVLKFNSQYVYLRPQSSFIPLLSEKQHYSLQYWYAAG